MLRIRNRHKSCEAAGQSRTAMTSSPRNLPCGRPPIKRGLTPGQPASIERPSTIGGEAHSTSFGSPRSCSHGMRSRLWPLALLTTFIGILITLVHDRIRLHECVLPMSSCTEAARCATYLPSPPISIEPGGAAAAAGRSPCGGLRGLARSRSPSEAPPNRCGRAKGRRAPQRLSGPPRVHRR